MTAARRALIHPVLTDRALAILRLVLPIAVEDDPAVAAARAAPPSWPALATLARARDTASRARFGVGFLELIHRLHGSFEDEPAVSRARGATLDRPPIEDEPAAWRTRGTVLDRRAIESLATALAESHGAAGTIRIVESAVARPRAFAVEPGREAAVVVPARADTPAAWFAVLHELGHAIAALVSPLPVSRVVDEAAAAYVARILELDEPPGVAPWPASPSAVAARRRRLAIAQRLDAIERALPAIDGAVGERPPWALWNDPGAQAAYVAAEALADQWWVGLGPTPPMGQFARQIADAERTAAGAISPIAL